MSDDRDDGFLSRWARRKALAREGVAASEPALRPALPAESARPSPAAPAPATPLAAVDPPGPAAVEPAAEGPPPPSLEDVSALTPASDFTRFVARDVDPGVRNAALKKLFADPQFNVMDGLDIYIDDYGKPDPLPAGMLRKMAHSAALNLFADDDKPAPDAPGAPGAAHPAPAEETETPPNEDPDLRLQPHDAAEPGGAEPGPEPDPGGER